MLLLRADYLIADPSLLEHSVIRDGALIVEKGRVVATGPWAELKKQYAHLESLCLRTFLSADDPRRAQHLENKPPPDTVFHVVLGTPRHRTANRRLPG